MAPRLTANKKSTKFITAEDLLAIKNITSVAISPDERKVAYTLERIDKDKNEYFCNIWLFEPLIGRTRQFTHGESKDSQIAWSPSGEQIAFVSVRDKKLGVYIMPAHGGAERKVAEFDGTVTNLQWTSDGTHLVFCLRYSDSHLISDEEKKKKPPIFRHITRLFYRLDGVGYLPKDNFQVYALNLKTERLRRITRGSRDNHSVHVSPDGKSICYISNRAKEQDIDALRQDLFVMPFKGGKERKLRAPAGPKAVPKFSPNNKQIAYIGHDNPDDEWGVTNEHVWLVDAIGRKPARDLLAGFDRMAADQTIADLADVHDTQVLFWSGDSKRLFFLSSDTGNTNCYYVPATGGKPTRIFKGDCHLKGLSVNGQGKSAAVIYADLTTPSQLKVFPTQYNSQEKAVREESVNSWLTKERKLGETKEVRFISFDDTEVQGFLTLPPNFSSKRKYPSVIMIHGGPRVQYGFSFFHEFQFLASQGFVVFYTNPRGGQGRGETWAGSIVGDWGGLDYKDVMAAADWLSRQRYIDKRRMGVGGGSYGGYMTNWIIGHTNRFAAAITMRSVVDIKSFLGSSDIGYAFAREMKSWPWTEPETWQRCSPINYFQNVKTPVLILHNEADLRCSIEQAEQMYVMLKVLGKTVDFVRFPEEPHGLSRHGRPDRRLARLQWISRWYKKYLS